jgi:hypothetical protein
MRFGLSAFLPNRHIILLFHSLPSTFHSFRDPVNSSSLTTTDQQQPCQCHRIALLRAVPAWPCSSSAWPCQPWPMACPPCGRPLAMPAASWANRWWMTTRVRATLGEESANNASSPTKRTRGFPSPGSGPEAQPVGPSRLDPIGTAGRAQGEESAVQRGGGPLDEGHGQPAQAQVHSDTQKF